MLISTWTQRCYPYVKTNKLTPLFSFLFLLSGLLFSQLSFSQAKCPNLNCTANDVQINRVYLGDANGNPLTQSCEPGTPQTAYLYIDFNTNATRNGLYFSGTLNGQSISSCFDQELKGNSTPVRLPDQISYTCGTVLNLTDIFVAYNPGQDNFCTENPTGDCDNIVTSKCSRLPSTVVQAPLVADFSAQGACSGQAFQTFTFSTNITGGKANFSYSIDYGDGNTATGTSTDGTETLTHTYTSAGSKTVVLTVTDANQKTDSHTETITVGTCCQIAVTCPTPNQSYNTDPNECNATLSFTATTPTSCVGATVAYSIGNMPITFPYDFPVGSTIVTATATDADKNTASCNFTVVVVNNNPPIDAGSYGPVCSDADDITLVGSPAGGVWSGTGVTGNKFDPSVGTQTLTYTVSGDCGGSDQTTITVTPRAVVDAGSYGPVCSDADDITLVGSPAGGVWSGTGVTGNKFDPSVGTQTLTYTVSGDCGGSDQTTITVTPRAVVDAGSYGPVCSDANDITLVGSPTGGVWSGTGVTGNTFDPSVGTQTLTYTVSGDCGGSDQTTITVNPAPNVDAGDYGPVCKDAQKITLIGSPSGGVWTGTGVTLANGVYTFNPSYGTQTLTYTYTGGCSGSDNTTIIVNDKPYVNPGKYGPLCDNGTKITLGGTPAGGSWSGAGVSYYNGVYKFDPHSGTQTIKYTYTDRNGCTNSAWVCITVIHCFEGCSPGYYKTHYQAWCNGTPSTFFFTKFSGITNKRGLPSTTTMAQAIGFAGGGYYALARHAVAALQNACHNAVDYPYTTTQILTAVKNMFNSGFTTLGGKNYSGVEALKNELDRANNLNCPLNNSNAVPTYKTNSVLDESTAALVTKLNVDVYPNPYTDVIRFVIQSPVSGEANLQVSNVLGQKIATVYKGRINAQSSQVIEFRVPTPIPQAVIYTLTIGNERVVGKLLRVDKQ